VNSLSIHGRTQQSNVKLANMLRKSTHQQQPMTAVLFEFSFVLHENLSAINILP
jgi:hypothetical protein